MIYKIAIVGFLAFVGVICYACAVVASIADDEEKEMWDNLWIDPDDDDTKDA